MFINANLATQPSYYINKCTVSYYKYTAIG